MHLAPGFYAQFTAWKWNTSDLVGQLDIQERTAGLPAERKQLHWAGLHRAIDQSLAEAVSPFVADEMRAFVVLPAGLERREISSRAWRESFFPERMFLGDEIGAGHGGEFDAAVGRTPFIRKGVATVWLKGLEPKRLHLLSSSTVRDTLIGLVMDGALTPRLAEDFRRTWRLPSMESRPPAERHNPKREVAWTLPMSLSWLVWRTYYRVAEAMDAYRAEWWEWMPCHRRLPLRGGAEWYEVNGAELRTMEPLSMFELGMLEALSSEDDFGGVAMTVKAARLDLWAKLAEGRLIATGIDKSGAVVQIPSHEWPYLALEADGNFMDRLVFANGNHARAYDKVTVRQLDVTSLWEGYPEPPSPPMMSMLLDDSNWTFLNAATWVGCKGQDLPSKQVADEDLEERGAYALFKALYPPRGLIATGMSRKRLREPIPAEYWEMATMDPAKFREQHYVSFIDEVLHGYGGQLTPVGEDTPRWFGIQLERDAMFAAFPEIASRLQPTATTVASDPTRSRKRAVARDAVEALYPTGIPKGLTEKELLSAVNAWLKHHGHSLISPRTLARAKNQRA